jgi:hypothetical protein
MDLIVRRSFTFVEEKYLEEGLKAAPPLRKVAAALVIENPYAGRYVADMSEMIAASVGIGEQLGKLAVAAMGPHKVQSYGKAGLVGTRGVQEHANALLTTAFANPIRALIGGGEAWISSMTKVAGSGVQIDVPMNCVDDVYVRSHYDGMTLSFADVPLPDEIVLIFCLANRGRLNARVGGLAYGQKSKPA